VGQAWKQLEDVEVGNTYLDGDARQVAWRVVGETIKTNWSSKLIILWLKLFYYP